MTPAQSPFDLYWIGAQDDCSGQKLNGAPVVANTRLQVAATQRASALMEPPDRVFVFVEIEKLLARLLGRRFAYVVDLNLFRSSNTRFGLQSEVWGLHPPGSTKGSARYICSMSRDGSGATASVTSVVARTYAEESTLGRPAVEIGGAALKIADATMKVQPGKKSVLTVQAIVARDPEFDVDILTSSDGTLDSYLYRYIDEISGRLSVSAADLRARFVEAYGPLLRRAPAALDVELDRVHVALDAGQSARLNVTVRTRTRIQALIVVRLTERRTGLQVFSDLIEVNPPERAGGDPPPSFDASPTAPVPKVVNMVQEQSQIFSGEPFVRRTR